MSIEIFEEFPFGPVDPRDEVDQFIDQTFNSIQRLEVKDDESFSAITHFYAESKRWEKKLDAFRKELNRPHQEKINAHNDAVKKVLDSLRAIQELAKAKTVEYQAYLEQKKREAEDMAQIFGEDVCLPEGGDRSIRGEKAVAYTRTVRDFRIVDLSQVPLKYLTINEEEVKLAIKLGIIEISGLEIFENKVTQLKVR